MKQLRKQNNKNLTYAFLLLNEAVKKEYEEFLNSQLELLWYLCLISEEGEAEKESSNSCKSKYTGKDLDADTGLYYFNARWYDSDTGRFTSEDPIKDGTNWYIYVGNNPLNYVDPTGLLVEVFKKFMVYDNEDMGTEESGYKDLENLKSFANETEIGIFHRDDPELKKLYGDVLGEDTLEEFSTLFDENSDGYVTNAFGKTEPSTYVDENGETKKSSPFHKGVDVAVKEGTVVRAVNDGMVKEPNSRHKDYGTHAMVDHGLNTGLYGHLSSKYMLPEGSKVHSGAPLGITGNTGVSTGAHLHFGWLNNITKQWVKPPVYQGAEH